MLTLTPPARAIAAFTIAVLLVFGQLNKFALALVLLFGSSYPNGRGGQFLTSLMLVAIALGAVAFAITAVNATAGGAGWDSHLARAAVTVAVVGLAIAILLGIGSVANGSTGLTGGVFNPGLFFS